MKWILILLESSPSQSKTKKQKKTHVIKGVAEIDDKIYLLDYVLFSNFEWWFAEEMQSPEDHLNTNITSNLFYNSSTNNFCSFEELPENIKKNII